MRRPIHSFAVGSVAGQLIGAGLATVFLAMATGCSRPSVASPLTNVAPAAASPPVRAVVHPERKDLNHRIEQPGFNIEAFQETALVSKISGYVRQWNADLGDRVRRDQVLAELDVPEMVVAVKQKEASVRQAEAQVRQARAAVLTAQTQLDRTKSQYERLARIGKSGVLDRENVEEARFAFEAAKANLEKVKADVAVAEAQIAIAESNRDYTQTMLGYAKVRAPFDGVITQRNINTGDFVQPASVAAKGRPLFVVSQIDPVRVFVNVPGADAPWIKDGDPVSFRLQGAGGELFTGQVTRNARSLNPQTRTLRTEIDLPNSQGKLLPGMYVHATIIVRHLNVWTLPTAAVVMEGDQSFCYRVEGGNAIRMPLQVGLRDGEWVEVLKKRTQTGTAAKWEDITGKEEIIRGGKGN